MATSSGSVFSETLQTITTAKLEELAKQRIAFEDGYASLLAAADAEEDVLKRVNLLVDGTKSCLGVKTVKSKREAGRSVRVVIGGTRNRSLETDLQNLDRFLEQARFDPSVSAKVLGDWEKTLKQHLSVQSSRFSYADLYGKLVTEWLSSEKSSKTGDGDVEMLESYEEVPGAKRLASRTEWEKTVFEAATVDVPAFKDYLDKLFVTDNKDGAAAIRDLRKKVEEFESSLNTPSQFTIHNLRTTISGLENSDLLSNEKREALKDFLSNDVILAEIADILNVRMDALNRWTWGEYVTLEQRRRLNGDFSIHFDPDLLQAIFLHHIGNQWSVFFKKSFFAIHDHNAWKSSQADIPKIDRLRREYFLGERGAETHNTLEKKRNKTHRNRYFAHQLLDNERQQIEMQDGEEEAEYSEYVVSPQKRSRLDASSAMPPPPAQMMATQASQRAAMGGRARQTARKSVGGKAPRMQLASSSARLCSTTEEAKVSGDDDDSDEDDDLNEDDPLFKRPMQAKQDLLHLVATEIIINKRLHGELTCLRTVFESWNPQLPHDTILTVLDFFGVSNKWQIFFTKFLQAPLKFADDESAPRPRLRGAPGSHSLSDVLGEVVLFTLDYKVNQATDGGLLHRLYDDLWFWNKDYEKCAKAWASIQEFEKISGVIVDLKKTGSVRISSDNQVEIDDRLPEGQIRWGFLYLGQNGRFEIDQKMVDGHIEELRKQLEGKSKSVIDYIQAWNSYAATFFSSNFGKASNCFGREHIDKMLATHRHIQERIFPGGSVVQHLKDMIEERFSITSVPEGFLFFPVELGGLDLKSPFVDLLQIRESVKENPYDLLDDFEEKERDDYNAACKSFDKGELGNMRYHMEDPRWKPEDSDVFFLFDEFVKHREAFHAYGKASLRRTYLQLLERPTEEPIRLSIQVKQALDQLQGQSNLRGIIANWNSMDAYWKWIAQMYGPEMLDRFGGLNVVDFGLLPIGMVSMFRQRRTKWQG
ncbi:hypothetical protein NX059_012541 [Plenodomus lindquistii]|nr:hypothetical protein NX059_012541 [Plenodomus lindquistii]